MTDITEFTYLDTEEMHLVGAAANGFDALLAKARDALEETVEDTDAEKAKMKAEERHKLDDSDFAFPKERKEPLNDESHVRNAISRFSSVEGVSGTERHAAARRIMARAKDLGIDVSDDSDVAQAAKAVSLSESESQTREVGDAEPAGPSPDNDDHGEAKHVAFPHGPSGDGQGDTAPDKDTHRSEAESQTGDNIEGNPAAKADGDGTGDTAPDKNLHEDEAESQTRDNAEGNAEKADTPGSPAWEHKDVALGEQAERLANELGEVVREFTEREKAEGGASKATWRTIRRIRSLLENPNILEKEFSGMSVTEALKALDEADEARREAKKAQRKAEAKKAAKKEAKKAAKAAEDEAAKAADAPTDTADQIAALRKQIDELASQDAKRVTVSAAGPTAVLRGPEAPNALKAFDDRVAEAQERLEKSSNEFERHRARVDLEAAQKARLSAKLVAADNARARGQLPPGRFGPNSADLFNSTSLTLPDEVGRGATKYIGA